jgi:hypothetical protein
MSRVIFYLALAGIFATTAAITQVGILIPGATA